MAIPVFFFLEPDARTLSVLRFISVSLLPIAQKGESCHYPEVGRTCLIENKGKQVGRETREEVKPTGKARWRSGGERAFWSLTKQEAFLCRVHSAAFRVFPPFGRLLSVFLESSWMRMFFWRLSCFHLASSSLVSPLCSSFRFARLLTV